MVSVVLGGWGQSGLLKRLTAVQLMGFNTVTSGFMRMKNVGNPSIITVLLFVVLTASGCGVPSGGSGRELKEVRQKLSGVPLSEAFSPELSLSECRESAAAEVLLSDLELTNANARAVWDSCQELYACSDAARRVSDEWRGKFRLGIAELQSLKTSTRLKDTAESLLGLYIPRGDTVYLNTSLREPLTVCSVLLHELVHRYDPNANRGESSLRTEYKAYWYQAAFTEELEFYGGEIASALSERNRLPRHIGHSAVGGLHSSETLMNEVARMYGFKPDYSLIKNFGRLPNELVAAGAGL